MRRMTVFTPDSSRGSDAVLGTSKTAQEVVKTVEDTRPSLSRRVLSAWRLKLGEGRGQERAEGRTARSSEDI